MRTTVFKSKKWAKAFPNKHLVWRNHFQPAITSVRGYAINGVDIIINHGFTAVYVLASSSYTKEAERITKACNGAKAWQTVIVLVDPLRENDRNVQELRRCFPSLLFVSNCREMVDCFSNMFKNKGEWPQYHPTPNSYIVPFLHPINIGNRVKFDISNSLIHQSVFITPCVKIMRKLEHLGYFIPWMKDSITGIDISDDDSIPDLVTDSDHDSLPDLVPSGFNSLPTSFTNCANTGHNSNSDNNTAVGYQSMVENTSEHRDTAVGYQSLADANTKEKKISVIGHPDITRV
jgi:hypothetical protein